MKVIAGTVVDGRIEFETELKEGTPIAVLVADESTFELTPDQEEELMASFLDIQNGRYEDGRTLLAELKGCSGR